MIGDLSGFFRRRLAVFALAIVSALVMASAAQAASCWYHNNSLMRLEDSGKQRWFYYANPKPSLRPSGVRPGTLLFNGTNHGDYYSGTARRFSRYCIGTPLEYHVEGPVLRNPLRIVLRGTRNVYRQCRDTGRIAEDTLIFTYSHRC